MIVINQQQKQFSKKEKEAFCEKHGLDINNLQVESEETLTISSCGKRKGVSA